MSAVPDAPEPPEPSSAEPPSTRPERPSSRPLRDRAARSSLWTVLGYGVALVLRLGSNVVLTRLLPPTPFGLMVKAGVVLQALEQFSDMGIKPSIVRSPRGKDPEFLNTAWTIQAMRGAFLWTVTLLLAWPAAQFYDEGILAVLLPLVGLTAIFRGLMSTSMATSNRDLNIGRVTVVELTAQVMGIAVMVCWAVASPSIWALAFGPVTSVAMTLVLSFALLPGIKHRFRWEKEARTELFGFGRWLFVSTGLAFLMSQGDRLILSTYVPTATLGVYSAAAQLSAVATGVIAQVSMKVLMPLYSRLYERGPEELRRGVFRARLVMMAVTFPIPALLVAFGDILVRILLGPKFHDAGWMLQLLAGAAVIDSLILSIWPVILASGDSFRYMLQVVGRTLLVTAGMLIGWEINELAGLIVGLAVGRLVGYPLLVWAAWRTRTWFPLLDLGALAYAAAIAWLGFGLLEWAEPLLIPFVAA